MSLIITIIGARPQFIKAAVLSREFKLRGIKELIIHTGQHYDYKMNEIFFEELGLQNPDINLSIGSGNHGFQTGEMLVGIEKIFLEQMEKIKFVLLYGDTNSTLSGALAASKLNIPIVHVEAGLRSFNKTMPEEINRIVTDHVSTLMFCSSDEGKYHLKNEGIIKNVHVVGDIMLDAFNTFSKLAEEKLNIHDLLSQNVIEDYLLLTIHRPSNTDNISNLQEILNALGKINSSIVWPVHPRNKSILFKIELPFNIQIFDPFSYFEMMVILKNCRKVVTDSGGLQKEAYWAHKPCITIRPETEWVETLNNNWNILTEPNYDEIFKALQTEIDLNSWEPLYGSGFASEAIADIIQEY